MKNKETEVSRIQADLERMSDSLDEAEASGDFERANYIAQNMTHRQEDLEELLEEPAQVRAYCAAYFAALEDDRDDDGDFVGAGR